MYETDVNGLILIYIKLIITSKVKIRRSQIGLPSIDLIFPLEKK